MRVQQWIEQLPYNRYLQNISQSHCLMLKTVQLQLFDCSFSLLQVFSRFYHFRLSLFFTRFQNHFSATPYAFVISLQYWRKNEPITIETFIFQNNTTPIAQFTHGNPEFAHQRVNLTNDPPTFAIENVINIQFGTSQQVLGKDESIIILTPSSECRPASTWLRHVFTCPRRHNGHVLTSSLLNTDVGRA